MQEIIADESTDIIRNLITPLAEENKQLKEELHEENKQLKGYLNSAHRKIKELRCLISDSISQFKKTIKETNG